jgi:hypothetical protein
MHKTGLCCFCFMFFTATMTTATRNRDPCRLMREETTDLQRSQQQQQPSNNHDEQGTVVIEGSLALPMLFKTRNDTLFEPLRMLTFTQHNISANGKPANLDNPEMRSARIECLTSARHVNQGEQWLTLAQHNNVIWKCHGTVVLAVRPLFGTLSWVHILGTSCADRECAARGECLLHIRFRNSGAEILALLTVMSVCRVGLLMMTALSLPVTTECTPATIL